MPAGFGYSNFTPRICLPSLSCELWEIIETAPALVMEIIEAAPALVSKSLTTELGSLSPTFYMFKTFFQKSQSLQKDFRPCSELPLSVWHPVAAGYPPHHLEAERTWRLKPGDHNV